MDFTGFNDLSERDLEVFGNICNELLAQTFIIRNSYNYDTGKYIINRNYNFLSRYYDLFKNYLSLLGWNIYKDDYHGYFYVTNSNEANRCNLNKLETSVLLTLRMIYEEKQDEIGLEHNILCTVGDIVEKLVNVYAIISAKSNMSEIKRILAFFEQHRIVQRLDGKFNQNSCKLDILPTILNVVSTEKMAAIAESIDKEENKDEKAEEASFE